jgi:hypothetical protein
MGMPAPTMSLSDVALDLGIESLGSEVVEENVKGEQE